MRNTNRNIPKKITLAVVFIIAVVGLFMPIKKYPAGHNLNSEASKENLVQLIKDELTSLEKSRPQSKDSTEKTVYIDGTKVIQVSKGDTITNLTTLQNIQNTYPTTNPNQIDTLSTLSCSQGQTIIFTSSVWACSDPTPVTTSDSQTLSINSDQLSIQNGNSVDLSVYKDNTDNQSLSLQADQLSLQNGGSVSLATFLDNTDLLSELSCLSGQIAKWNGSNWVCSEDLNVDTTYTAGTGLNLIANEFSLDPNNISAVSSLANSDVLLIGTSSGVQKISYNDLFGDILGSLNYRGTWDPATNWPDLTNYCDSSTKGHYFVASNPGNTTLGGFSGWQSNDWAICDGNSWQRIESTNTVNSVFGRTGYITAQTGDYTASQITSSPTGTLSASNVQAALDELTAETLPNSLGSAKVYVGNGSNVATAVNITGDASLTNNGTITLNTNSVTTDKILDGTILLTDLANNGCTAGQVLKYNGTAWSCGSDIDTYTSYSAGSGIAINGSNVISASLGSDIATGEIIDGTIASSDIAAGAITSGLILDSTIVSADIADGTITFADWSNNGCTAGQVPRYNGTNWACGETNPNVQSKTSDIATAQANTQVTLGELQFRYDSNATNGNLEVRSSTAATVPLRASPAERYPSGNSIYNVVSLTANASSGGFQTIFASGASTNEILLYEIWTATNIYKVKISNFNNTNITLWAEKAI